MSSGSGDKRRRSRILSKLKGGGRNSSGSSKSSTGNEASRDVDASVLSISSTEGDVTLEDASSSTHRSVSSNATQGRPLVDNSTATAIKNSQEIAKERMEGPAAAAAKAAVRSVDSQPAGQSRVQDSQKKLTATAAMSHTSSVISKPPSDPLPPVPGADASLANAPQPQRDSKGAPERILTLGSQKSGAADISAGPTVRQAAVEVVAETKKLDSEVAHQRGEVGDSLVEVSRQLLATGLGEYGNSANVPVTKSADSASSTAGASLVHQMSQLRGDRSRHHSRASTMESPVSQFQHDRSRYHSRNTTMEMHVSQFHHDRSRHHSRNSTMESHVSHLPGHRSQPSRSRLDQKNAGNSYYHSYESHFSTTSLKDLVAGTEEIGFDPGQETADYVYVDRTNSSTRLEASHLLYRAGSRLWEESREIKGQSWLGTRASSTALDELAHQPPLNADDASDDEALHMGRYHRSRAASFDSDMEETVGYFRRSRTDESDLNVADMISRNKFIALVDWVLGLRDDVGGGLTDFLDSSRRQTYTKQEKFSIREENNAQNPIDIAYVLGLSFYFVR